MGGLTRAAGGIALAVLLLGCHATSDQPGAVTGDEAHQLNDAAAMLDANSVSAGAVTNQQDSNP